MTANADSLWRLASSSQFDDELSTIQPPASISTDQVIEMSVENLNGLVTGDVITLSFADTQAFDFVITGQTSYINGDKGWQAKWVADDGFVLSLTYSAESVVASVYSPVGKYQLRAFINPSDNSSYIGWLSAENPDARYAPIDDGGEVPPIYTTKQSFLLSGQPIDNGNSVSGLSDSDVSIVQTFSNDVTNIGDTVDVSIVVTNNLTSDIINEVLTVWFALDKAELVTSDSNCSTDRIKGEVNILICTVSRINIGGSFTVNYTLRTTAESYPYIANSVFIGEPSNVETSLTDGQVRDDEFIFVIKDTLVDSDNDGISDFNEDILGTDPTNSSSVIADNFVPTVDLMFLYTQRFLNDIGSASPETEINALVQLANEMYANSGAVVEFRAVHYEQTDYVIDSPDLASTYADLIAHTDATLQTIPALRTATGADITVLIDGLIPANASICGMGTIAGIIEGLSFKGELFHPYWTDQEIYTAMFMPGKSRASNYTCSDNTFAHELGHNLGLDHSRRESSYNSGTFGWSRGHGVDGSFVTIMATASSFPGSTELPLFSNPLNSDCNGLPCGVSRNNIEQGADAVLSINTTRFQVANKRDSVVAPSKATPTQSSQIERKALIALYNSTNGANWKDNTGWLGAAGTECNWYGIACSAGSVFRIRLHANTLSGSIPAELGNLTNLTNLDLSTNSLSGGIPSELGNLTNLTTLDLYNNPLSGSIPSELGNLTNLIDLFLFVR